MSGHGNHAEEAVTRAVVSALAAAGMRILDVDARDSAVIFVPDKGEDPVRLSLESLRLALPVARYATGSGWRVQSFTVDRLTWSPGYGSAVTVTPETARALFAPPESWEQDRERAARERAALPTPEESRRIREQVEGLLSDQLESALVGSDEGQGAGPKVEPLPVR
jgi:hypothetical protein